MTLVELDGSPAAPVPAESWPAWTDNFFWEPGATEAEVCAHLSEPESFPTADDLAWLAETEAFEASERARIEREYPLDRDDRRCLDAPLPPRNQISETELAMVAAGMAL